MAKEENKKNNTPKKPSPKAKPGTKPADKDSRPEPKPKEKKMRHKLRDKLAREAAADEAAKPAKPFKAPRAPKQEAQPTVAPEIVAPAVEVPAPEPVDEPAVEVSPTAKAHEVEVEVEVEAIEAQAVEAPEAEVQVEEEPVSAFASLNLMEPVARAIKEMGFEAPTPIQANAIPLLLEGHDLIGQAQTGTGKTAAFGIPLIHKVSTDSVDTQALVLAPTRELAIQVAGGIYDFAKHTGLRIVPIYGGQPIDRQFRALRGGAQIVVGTPGRVLDHMRRGSLVLEHVKFCALDEADEMLALGFLEDIEAILSELPEERQTAFFSATIPPRVSGLMKKYLRDPKHVAIETKQRTLDTTNQSYYEVPPGKKFEALVRVLDMETPGPTFIFCRTRQETNDLAEGLQMRGYGAEALHGDMSQAERERVLRRFREEQVDLLVATDVAARGLDIENVTHVINYDIPWDVEQYIHRIGRTGRAGRSGDAITLVVGRERRQLRIIEQAIGAKIKPARIPTAADIAERRRALFKDSLKETLEASEFDGQMATVEELSENFDPSEIAAAALHMLWQQQNKNASAQEAEADGEQPELGMTRLFIRLGRQEGLRARDLVGAITNETGLSSRDIGTIDVLDHSTFLEVPVAASEEVLDALGRLKWRGKRLKVGHARAED